MEMLVEPRHTGVGIQQCENWKIHVHQYTKVALLVLLSLCFCQTVSPYNKQAAYHTLAGRVAPAPPIGGTEAGSPKPPPASKPVQRKT
jgi:hypothetical protein